MPVTVRCDLCGNEIAGKCVRVRLEYSRKWAGSDGLTSYDGASWTHNNLVLHEECAKRQRKVVFDLGGGMKE